MAMRGVEARQRGHRWTSALAASVVQFLVSEADPKCYRPGHRVPFASLAALLAASCDEDAHPLLDKVARPSVRVRDILRWRALAILAGGSAPPLARWRNVSAWSPAFRDRLRWQWEQMSKTAKGDRTKAARTVRQAKRPGELQPVMKRKMRSPAIGTLACSFPDTPPRPYYKAPGFRWIRVFDAPQTHLQARGEPGHLAASGMQLVGKT